MERKLKMKQLNCAIPLQLKMQLHQQLIADGLQLNHWVEAAAVAYLWSEYKYTRMEVTDRAWRTTEVRRNERGVPRKISVPRKGQSQLEEEVRQ